MITDLNFESLFNQALKNWPDAIDLSALQYAEPDLSNYAVKGLGVLIEDIENTYIGMDAEAITRTLHYALSDVIHAVAKLVLKLELTSIRPESVRLFFERRLMDAAAASDLNWKPEDYALAEAYFAQNPPHANSPDAVSR